MATDPKANSSVNGNVWDTLNAFLVKQNKAVEKLLKETNANVAKIDITQNLFIDPPDKQVNKEAEKANKAFIDQSSKLLMDSVNKALDNVVSQLNSQMDAINTQNTLAVDGDSPTGDSSSNDSAPNNNAPADSVSASSPTSDSSSDSGSTNNATESDSGASEQQPSAENTTASDSSPGGTSGSGGQSAAEEHGFTDQSANTVASGQDSGDAGNARVAGNNSENAANATDQGATATKPTQHPETSSDPEDEPSDAIKPVLDTGGPDDSSQGTDAQKSGGTKGSKTVEESQNVSSE